ncbi:MAG TPA: hypothetical protein VF787_00340 [Thermoanaerobaculia bacterium]
MQRFFSAFPDGSPGAGLLLLRVAAGFALLMRGFALFVAHDATAGAIAIAVLALMAGVSLLAGFMTPIAGAIAVIASVNTTPLIDTAIISAALILLGPGAFSIDARLFGRREITIPD